jgi:hypothetical protein
MHMMTFKPAVAAIVLGFTLCASSAFATEQAHQRRDARETRQDGRHDSRNTKQDCRQDNQKSNSDCRQDKRGSKQDAREAGREIKY